MMHPKAIHYDARSERVIGLGEPPRQSEAAARSVRKGRNRSVRFEPHPKHGWYIGTHTFADQIGVAAAQQVTGEGSPPIS